VICPYCGTETKAISHHINKYHSEISLSEFYIGYYLDGIHPLCESCGKPARFNNASKGFKDYCSTKCARKLMTKKADATKIAKYGSLEAAKASKAKKTATTNIERYGSVNVFSNKEVIEKIKKSLTPEIKAQAIKKAKATKAKRTTEDKKLTLEKTRQTTRDKYGVDSYSQTDKFKNDHILAVSNRTIEEREASNNKRKNTCTYKYGVDSVSKVPEIQSIANKRARETQKKTLLEKYGVDNISNIPGVVEKIHTSKKANGSYCKSSLEESLYLILKEKYETVERQHKSVEYPFACDFYIPSENLYIELQGFYSHRLDKIGSFYNSKEQKGLVLILKGKNKKSYDNYLNVWTITDPIKREVAKGLNWIELFEIDSLDDMMRREKEGLAVTTDVDKLKQRLYKLKYRDGDINSNAMYGDIIYNYQLSFFKKENELYSDKTIRAKLISNRMKYLNKKENELTDKDLLTGFKKSGIHYGYSHFSPLWIKFFIDRYNITSIYDMFGGWGHRMLGCTNLESYIYNDISKEVHDGVSYMREDLAINNTVLYNEDASELKPKENYEAVFISPPYDNLEKYEVLVTDFSKLVADSLNCINKDKAIAVVIREDLINYYTDILGSYTERFVINEKNSHLASKKLNEYMYIFINGNFEK
jgi:hypothetical protein